MLVQQWFRSKIVAIRQHRSEHNIGVVRVRDSMQTYIGDWVHLQHHSSTDSDVVVFAHGARVSCLWSALTPIEQQHLTKNNDGTNIGSNTTVEATVRVLKINRLISFGIVQTLASRTLCPCTDVHYNFDRDISIGGSADGTMSKSQNGAVGSADDCTLLLTQHPPVLRHLLNQPCAILQWCAQSAPAIVIDFDESSGFHQVAAPMRQTPLASTVQEFCAQTAERFRQLVATAFGQHVCRLTVSLLAYSAGDGTAANLKCDAVCLHSATHHSVWLSRATTAHLCQQYDIPSHAVVAYQCDGGLYEWLALQNAVDAPTDTLDAAVQYNDTNSQLHRQLCRANRQPDNSARVFSDTQVLEAMKHLQTQCDEYCKRPENRAHCSGLCIQFDQLPTMLFHVPSLFFLLQKK